MATRKQVEMVVTSRDNRELPKTRGTVTQVFWDKAERSKNAVRTLGTFLLATFVSIFIPILHWILVPGLLVTSFVLALDKLNETERSEGGTAECPKCHKEFAVQGSKGLARISNNCQHCGEDLELTQAIPSAN